MITTIQLREDTKKALLKLKEKNETYEEIILNLIRSAGIQKRKQEELMIEGCKEMAEESLKITKELEAIEDLSQWEWNEN